MTGPELLSRVLALLDERGVAYARLEHAPARSTEHAAALRGAPVSLGCKALLMKVGGVFTVVALRADREMDNRRFRHEMNAQKLRFARREELLSLTGCVPGQLPPLGPPALPMPLVADRSVLAEPELAFTAGTHTDSIRMATADWLALAAPRLLDFSSSGGA
ncbi:MAG: hypothetical protein H6741_11935 [Alphaproteobacteria bacterium]|nr:hypothetical protein [Alphaproteobacteria bacterium]MCB9793422.1 hypothetical protein [Alphaproteobacteria bacterium]